MLSVVDKRGGALFDPYRATSFWQCIDNCGLLDLGFAGLRHTWFRGNLGERLDWGLASPDWKCLYPIPVVRHLPRLRSDHRPILLCFFGLEPPRRVDRPFRFLVPWMAHHEFPDILARSWEVHGNAAVNLMQLAKRLKKWNKESFGSIFRRKATLSKTLAELELQMADNPSEAVMTQEARTRVELEQTLWEEAMLWKQKSCRDWIRDGDKNTHFFHLSTLKRRSFNKITALRRHNGSWEEEANRLKSMARDYFIEVYSDAGGDINLIPNGFVKLMPDQASELQRRPSSEEIYSIVKSVGGFKAPGKDGFHPIFFQRQWSTVGSSVASLIQHCFINPDRVAQINETIIVLIPKRAHPECMTHFRPISLCNVSYKILTKCIATRLRSLMPSLVTSNQASFVPGRQIAENIIILQEVVHSMERLKGREKRMVLKVDLMKAYDRIRWVFLEESLLATGMGSDLVELIMTYVRSAKFEILWNGGLTDQFSPQRGIRQGCPLSPFLFTICMERLSHIIDEAVACGDWKPIALSPGGPQLSHLFYADDLILFAEASEVQARVIRKCLDRFSAASGQEVSREKSAIFCSKNTNRHVSSLISLLLGIPLTQNLGRYLGVPILHDRVNVHTYQDILDRIDSKLAGWKVKSLSLAGRVTLAQSVLAAIPAYPMQTSVLPAKTCEEIDRRIRNFVWGTTGEGWKVPLVA
ncbi:LINE-1 retrotransposable element ORF2 protein [Linum perenne]